MTRVSARSRDTMKNGRPKYAQARFHGISARQKSASSVPTAFALSEFHRSPCIRSEKLVVIPHDGHGKPVTLLNVQGGSPNCRCVSIRRGWPSASYGFSQTAIEKTTTSPRVMPTRAPRTQVFRAGMATITGSWSRSVGNKGAGTIATTFREYKINWALIPDRFEVDTLAQVPASKHFATRFRARSPAGGRETGFSPASRR